MRCDIRSFAVGEDRNNVAVCGVCCGSGTGEGGPVPPTEKPVEADYVYAQSDGDKIRHLTKAWSDSISLKQLGWT